MHPKHLSIADYNYSLPEDKIAKYPLGERDASKLIVFKSKTIHETIYRNIDQYLSSNSLLIFNNTRVVEARLLFQKPTGALIEIFCLEPHQQHGNIHTAMLEKASVIWLCLIGGASKWKAGQVLQRNMRLPDRELVLTAEFLEKAGESFAIRLSWTPEALSFADVLHYAGTIPLPPYLKRPAESTDRERYQTLYANVKGSVAAPTAGLHFTGAVFDRLASKHITSDYVTLHVGAGTFKPVKANKLEFHEMHAEFIDVDRRTIKNIIEHLNGLVTAIGTTSLRTIESLYWMGVKLILDENIRFEDLLIKQWEPYELPAHGITSDQALKALLTFMENKKIEKLVTKTQVLIAPGYEMKIANALVTNFHQPNSTLLLLIAAFVGEDWKKIYEYALTHEFRFLSYGDGCLLFRD